MSRRRKEHEEKEVDLAALVDVLSNMLFFLLATVTFLQLKTLNASVPALSSGPVSTGKSVDVSLEIRTEGYVLKVTGEPTDKSTVFNVNESIPRKGDGHLDTKALTAQLWEVKKKAGSDAKNMMIFPQPGTVFEDIVKTMDASREMPSVLDPKRKVPLFTRPVLSELDVEETPPGTPPAPPVTP